MIKKAFYPKNPALSFKLCNQFQKVSTLFEDTLDTLTPFHKNLQTEALSFASNHLNPLSAHLDKSTIFPKQAFISAGKLGYGGVCGPESYGGRNSGILGGTVIFQAMAESDVGVSAYLSINNILGEMLEKHGSQELKDRYLRKLYSLEKISCYCLSEPGTGSDAISLKVSAKEDGDDFVVNGIKSLVIGAGENQVFLLICRTSEKEISALVVDSDSKGITLSKKPETLGFRAIPIRDVTFIDCRVPKKNLLGKRGEGFKYAMKVLEHERLNIASCALGGATFCLKQAIAHYKMTKTKLIHQEFEFKLSDLACKLMACKLLLRQAATALDNKEIKAFQLSAQTKWFVPFTSFEIVDECMKLFQEQGVMSEMKIEKYFRDVRGLQFAGGTVEIMKHALQRDLLK